MIQMDLFDGLKPVSAYLHVWTDAARARAIKKSCATALETQDNPANRGEETADKRPASAFLRRR